VAQLVEALRLKPEFHGFDFGWGQVDSAFDRIEYQEYFRGVGGGWLKAAGA
jgi:hypothetical protein